jgi:hypothetical protein
MLIYGDKPPMGQTVGAMLKDMVMSHGQAILGQPKRFEELLRDKSLATAEKAALVATLREKLPQQLAASPPESLTTPHVATLATQLSAETALREDLMRWAIEAWAESLDRKIRNSDSE